MNNSQNSLPHKDLLFLDGLRGLAALYVVVGHARWLLWEGYSEGYLRHPDDYNLFNKCLMYFFSVFKFGHEVVLFFFVLSGFVIHLGYSKKFKKSPNCSINWWDYVKKRTRRIYPPFLFAILVTFLLDYFGHQSGFTIYKGLTPYKLINENIGSDNHYDINTLIGNVLFLFKEYVPVYGTNGPAWSLKYEWWFYMLYPLFIILSKRNVLYSFGAIIILYVASFFNLIWPENLIQDVFSMMICWWLGVVLADSYTRRIRVSLQQIFATSAACYIGLAFLRDQRFYNLQIALFFMFIVSALLIMQQKKISFYFLNRLKFLGDFSYSLYIIHFPILVFISGLIMNYENNKLPSHFYYFLIGIMVTIIIAYLTHHITEKPFIKKNSKI